MTSMGCDWKNGSGDEATMVAFVSLGCAKNLVDSEKMLGQLAEAGCVLTPVAEEADVIVINTCGFLAAGRTEAIETIAEMNAYKTKGLCSRLVVVGCLVQRDGEDLLKLAPGIDALVGVNRRDDLVSAVLGRPTEETGPDLYLGEYYPRIERDDGRLRLTPRHYAYLRISEGCDQKCTFCTIPSIRGPMHSKPIDAILDEARELIADGAVELVLIGQDTTSYGQDIGYEPGLAGLLRAMNELDGVEWLRLMYAYPSVFTDEMIEAIASCERVVKYVDIPLQHINDRLLKAMARRTTRVQTERLLETLRERVDNIAIRTTFIAGFPGETDAEFEELVDFVQGAEFDALGVFAYSQEPDTPAGRMDGQLPADVKQARADALMAAQQPIAFARAKSHVGRRFKVPVESADEKRVVGRHAGQAPEVDPVTILPAADVDPGEWIDVQCRAADGYDLLAEPRSVSLPILS